jgi:hypothetical protein
MFKGKYSDAFKTLIGRKLKQGDGFDAKELAECEKRLKLKLPSAFREYCEFARKLPINTEHNILYGPKKLKIWKGKLLLMEQNQRGVFRGLDVQRPNQADLHRSRGRVRLFLACRERGTIPCSNGVFPTSRRV